MGVWVPSGIPATLQASPVNGGVSRDCAFYVVVFLSIEPLPAVRTRLRCFGIRCYPYVLMVHYGTGGAWGSSAAEEESGGGQWTQVVSLETDGIAAVSRVTGSAHMDLSEKTSSH
ncbi:hypothetical protein NDU88_007096 [Pleurodeles waltl]|uniref:Uncharacterized protein n=1 Tax=Pleurodeles waltl TaxID=8319 RepID=A0AAV7M1Y9_PLEWA|nr:hypothetical protein NDU88_007096 [Pleurodeles waltl]